MFRRLLDAFGTQKPAPLDPRIEQEINRLAAARGEARQLIQEMDDCLEKFSRVVARQAKRRKRDMDDAMEEREAEAAQVEQQPPSMVGTSPPPNDPQARAEWKKAIRHRMGR